MRYNMSAVYAFEPGQSVKQWALLKNGERVFVDRQNGDGKRAWYYAGFRKIDPEDIVSFEEWGCS